MNRIIDNYENFIKALNSVKRKSSVLDKIIAVYTDQMNEFYGLAFRTGKAYSAVTDAPNVDYTMLTNENSDQLMMKRNADAGIRGNYLNMFRQTRE
jgi:hypothetical protein